MVLGLTENDVRIARLRAREALAVAAAERTAQGVARASGVPPLAVRMRRRLGEALVVHGLKLQRAHVATEGQAVAG